MDKEAGHKRKEFSSKSKSAIKKFWFNWFGDIHPFKPISRFFTSIITFIKRSMGKFILFSVLVFGGIIGLIFSELIIEKYKTFSYYRNIQYLRDSAIELNKNCPQQINDFTIATSIELTKENCSGTFRQCLYADSTYGLTYNYKHTKLLSEVEYLTIQKDITNSFCSDDLYKFYRKNNFHLQYYWKYRNLTHYLIVSRNECSESWLNIIDDVHRGSGDYYEVKNGESLEDIIKYFKVTKEDVNKIDSLGHWKRGSHDSFSVNDGDILYINDP